MRGTARAGAATLLGPAVGAGAIILLATGHGPAFLAGALGGGVAYLLAAVAVRPALALWGLVTHHPAA